MVGQSKTAMVVLAMLVAACAGEAVGETTTTLAVEEPSTSTTRTATRTTAVEPPTTTRHGGPVDICRGRAEVWVAGQTYVAECFFVPVSFIPGTDDWNSFGADDEWIFLTWSDPNEESEGSLGVLAYRETEDQQAIVDVIVARNGVSQVSEVTETEVAGRDALVVDVEGDRRPVRDYGPCRDVYELYGPPEVGFQSCAFSRVWVVDIGDERITFIGTIRDPEAVGDEGPDRELFEQFIPEIERLLDSMTFEAP